MPFGPLLALVVLSSSGSAEASILPAPSVATQTLTTPRFAIAYTPRATGAARLLAAQVERLRDEIANAIGSDWDGVTTIRLGRNREEFVAMALPNRLPPSWATAIAYPDKSLILLETRSVTEGDGQQTLRHELVHVALGRLGSQWPRWFQEGYAMTLTGERSYRLSQFQEVARAVASHRILPLASLTRGFPEDADAAQLAYAQSAAFVGFLRQRHGGEPFRALLLATRAGQSFESAFAAAFRSSVSSEERVFLSDIATTYPRWASVLAHGNLDLALGGIVLVVAFFVRRRRIAVRRGEQARAEALEDLGAHLISFTNKAANDDGALRTPHPLDPPPWLLMVVREVAPGDDGGAGVPLEARSS